MTQVSWDVIYRPAGVSPSGAEPRQPRRFGFLLSWEAWLTLLLVGLVQLPVVGSLESTKWVNEMPSLTLASLVGLTAGWVLASTRGRALWLHLVGVAIGAGVVFGEVLATMQLADPLDSGAAARWSELWLRLRDWGQAAVTGGVSSDPLPFVLMIVLLVFSIAYVSSWAAVRWQNVWAALVPGGFVLLTNISYLPGQPSFSFVVFLFAAILLVARMHFLQALLRWNDQRVSLPDFMSIEVLFAGAWVGLVLVLAAWAIPTANHWGPIADRWVALMQPVNERIDRVGRLFVGINSKKPLPAHAFSDVFPLRGKIALSSAVLLEVTAPNPVNLRGAVYDEYTGSGWRISSEHNEALPGTSVQAAAFGTPLTKAQVREPVSVTITVVGDLPDRRLLTAGEPLAASVDAQAIVGAGPTDVIGLAPDARVQKGDEYTTVGTLSAASVDTLTASGRGYPADIVQRYTQLPSDLPAEVRPARRPDRGRRAAAVRDRAARRAVPARELSVRLERARPAAPPRHRRLLPLRLTSGLFRLRRLRDGGAAADARHPDARRDGVRARQVRSQRDDEDVRRQRAARVGVARGLLRGARLGRVQSDADAPGGDAPAR